jgi:hypothetical protein
LAAPPAEPIATAPVAPVLAPPAQAPPAPSKRRPRLVASLIFSAIVVLLLGAIAYVLYQRFFSDPTRDAVAGNCLADLPIVAVGADQEVRSARIVECTDPAAMFVVEGRLDRVSEAQASSVEICQAYEDARFIYRAVPAGGSGYVLCLRQLDE